MKQWVLNNRGPVLLTIAVYEVIGGIVALWLIYNIASRGINAGMVIALLPLLAIMLCSLFAGIVYFFKGETTRFFLLSKINFCAQLIRFSAAGVQFVYFYGFFFIAGIDGNRDWQLFLGVKLAEFSISLGQSAEQFFILNFFPLLPLIFLRWCERNPAKDPAEDFLLDDGPVQ